jgi:uncharacterized coiled-coil DUF342 family protein
MAITGTQLRQIIKEEISKVLQEGLTPEKRKELSAKAAELRSKHDDVEEKLLDLGNEIAKVESDIEDAKGSSEKAPLKKKLAALKEKEKTLVSRMDDAWDAYSAVKKQLGQRA